ncbi:MAG: hypothetical protein OXU27_05620 [Candidatus Poribacteria bacterium]|nr:hypothetical protein [Candidatus Poribacteria bacterium]
MFKEQLKKQYWWYYCVGLFLAVWNIISTGFRDPIVLDILANIVLVALFSFVVFCVVYCSSWIGKKIPPFKQGAKMLWVLLLISALSLPFAENTDARNTHPADPYGDRFGYGGGGGGGSGRGAVIGGVSFAIGYEFNRIYGEARDAVVNTVKKTVTKVTKTVKEAFSDSEYCGPCGGMRKKGHSCTDYSYYYGSSGL